MIGPLTGEKKNGGWEKMVSHDKSTLSTTIYQEEQKFPNHPTLGHWDRSEHRDI